jgi:hypothetical protein
MRDIKLVRTIVDGVVHFDLWAESPCGTYYIKVPPSNIEAQDLRMAEWDLMRGRPNPLADELALYPQTVLNPQSLKKGKNK